MKTSVQEKSETLVEKQEDLRAAQNDLKYEIHKESVERAKESNESMQQVSRVSKILNTSVTNHQGDDLGNIQDLVINPETGQVVYVVVSFGGVFGLGDKLFAVPLQALHWSREKEFYILDVNKTLLEKAPGFDKDHWPDSFCKWDQQREELHQFYRVTP